MGRLVLIEGIPGSGKTTISKKIAGYLSSTNRKTNFFEEGDSHPADLAWCACIPFEQFDDIVIDYPAYESLMRQNMYQEEGYMVVAYTRFPIEDASFYQRMESYEVYDNRVGLETFVDLHKKKWTSFSKQAMAVDEFTVFECAFLQNHINELLLFHCSSEKEIEDYLLELIHTVKGLNPVMVYLNQPNVYETIRRVSDARFNEKGEKDWMERVIPYLENSPYGKLHKQKGFEGMVAYFEERKRIELAVIKKLPIETHIIDNPDYNWDKVWEEVQKIIQKL
ncbi:MAG: P-loop NTPase family protein [Mobilitalea sp.]